MKETASTKLTFFWKFIFPVALVVCFGLPAIQLAVNHHWESFLSGLVALLYTGYLVWLSPRLKHISFDDAGLYILDHSHELHVAWTEVECIHPLYMRWPTYAVKFRHPGPFGRRVFFLLPYRADPGLIERMQKSLRSHK